MFEKSLYDLIRGLRNHKGNERQYIQDSIRECRKEIRGQDMDLKATALLKLTYLEMFGHDMSWASFNVLEVMSSSKFSHKRVGYLGAIQSFRSDTEVMMLAENLLKKDIASTSSSVISLPLTAIPHVLDPTMAGSLLSDVLPRLSHSNPAVRKKTIVTLYRIALAYPDTLRASWPKIKDRLSDEQEDPGVTAAIINVICELGWRRPLDFLPLAPRLFDLLVDGGNNWMAIKIIKLFAVLVPIEPRLVRKLLAPLTTLIKTTQAMSLLYECIDGIIQGGILTVSSGSMEGDEIARLCVGKLRNMIADGGDPNLRFVALLAFNKIVESHPNLVSANEDVILECIDDPDVSIRVRALDLAAGMVSSSNLPKVVGILIGQLRDSRLADSMHSQAEGEGYLHTSMHDYDDEDAGNAREDSRRVDEQQDKSTTSLPDESRIEIIKKILQMCSKGNYSNIDSFDWYLGVIVGLIKEVPHGSYIDQTEGTDATCAELSNEIGSEIVNIAVRVQSLRPEAVSIAATILSADQRGSIFGGRLRKSHRVIEGCAFVVGEFASLLVDPQQTLSALTCEDLVELSGSSLKFCLQALIKVFSEVVNRRPSLWTSEKKSQTILSASIVTRLLEAHTSHISLQVQELAVGYLELMRLATDAATYHAISTSDDHESPPLLLSQALPALFHGIELNPVSKEAQKRIPLPEDLDLHKSINPNLDELLSLSGFVLSDVEDDSAFAYYMEKPRVKVVIETASQRLDAAAAMRSGSSYQQYNVEEDSHNKLSKADKHGLAKDDPFYIMNNTQGSSKSLDDMIRGTNGDALDVDAIPILELDLESTGNAAGQDMSRLVRQGSSTGEQTKKPRAKVEILGDETLDDHGETDPIQDRISSRSEQQKASFLGIDSSSLGALSLINEGPLRGRRVAQLEFERQKAEEAEMAKALREVEKLRLEMQRAQERIESGEDIVLRTSTSKKKSKKPNSRALDFRDQDEHGTIKEVLSEDGNTDPTRGVEKKSKKEKKQKKKKKLRIVQAEDS